MYSKNVIITGGSSGLGKHTARYIAQTLKGTLILTGSTTESAAEAAEEIRDEVFTSYAAEIYGLARDLASPDSITRFIDEVDIIFNGKEVIDVIAFNAGVQIVSGLHYSPEGFERTIAVNHLGHLRLLMLLRPFLRRPVRVIFTASGTHDPDNRLAKLFGFRGGRFQSVQSWVEGIGDPDRSRVQQGMDRYADSKLANIMTAMELSRRYDKSELEVFAYDPGFMPGTGLARDRNKFERILWHTLIRWVFPVFPGASTPEKSGRKLAEIAKDRSAASRMLDQSLSLLNMSLPASLQNI